MRVGLAVTPTTNWAKLAQFPSWIRRRKRSRPPLAVDAVARVGYVPPLVNSASRERMRGARFTVSTV